VYKRQQGYGREAADEAGAFPQRLTAFIDAESGRLRDDVSVGILLDLARGCALYGLSAGRPAALKLAVQDLYPEVRRRDRGEVRGYVEPAGLLLARYNVREARALYEEALDLNPNHPEAHLGLARCHWQAGQRQDARFRAERTLATNPHHPGAHALLARIDLAVGRLDSAREHVGRALATNPHLGEAQALGMVLRLVEGDLPEDLPGELTTLPTPAQARVYRELGSWLSDHRRYGEAELQFQRALLVSPQDPEATAGLGLCYFRWGKEDRARKTLDQAFQLDSFNVRVFNALEVLDALSEYTERRREHLIVRSPREMAFLAEYVAAFGEEVLGHLLEQFGVEAQEPVVVELLPSRDLFSARVTGLPGLDLNAACLGQVVVVGPTAADRPFNWYDALVHELTHAVCYLAAQGRAPQWLEEGLALWAEGTARPRSWNLILLHAHQAGGLLPLAELDRALVAEPGSAQRALAYAQSALAVEFLVQRLGWETLRSLLGSAARLGWHGLDAEGGPSVGAVAVKHGQPLRVSPWHPVEAHYREFLDVRCRELKARMALASSLTREWQGGDPMSQASMAALVRLLGDEPGAFELLVVREFAAQTTDSALAEAALRALVRVDRTDVESALTLAKQLRAAGRGAEAEQACRVALGADLEDPRVHVGLAGLAWDAGRREDASQEAEVAWGILTEGRVSLRLEERGQAWQGLAEVFAALGDVERAEQARLRARGLLGAEEARQQPVADAPEPLRRRREESP